MTWVGRSETARLCGVVRRRRAALLMGTALRAGVLPVFALPAAAQPAPNARPTGGAVVAGAAAISRGATDTRIDQSSQRAAIDWRSFDVGSSQSVTFSQPSAGAVALNRVTGPDPSQIAGRIEANGQVILVNQSGVNFYKGAQVNTNGLMVSAANIGNGNFMAGVMAFDQPGKPDARIDNQGSITVRQAGLAAFVAPQVANSGTISAKLGHVVLAGAKTATLDLYGDGMLSLDVTNQVAQVPVGKDGKPVTALVTNTGLIAADGGTVQLTARAADGIVQNLVQAGGTIRAATVGNRAGTVALNGIGGSIVVEGQLAAPGTAPGAKGGAIEVAADGSVVLATTARLDASGKAGGGVVAIGTTLARARGGPGVTPALIATDTVIQPGAKVSANATAKGDGGRVTVLSRRSTTMAGTINARGGPSGGNGGSVEVSGNAALAISGSVDLSAPLGQIGTITLDPGDLYISDVPPVSPPPGFTVTTATLGSTAPDTTTLAWVSPKSLAAFNADIVLGATHDLFVAASSGTGAANTLTLAPGRTLVLAAGHDLTVDRGFAIAATGISLTADGHVVLGADAGSAAGTNKTRILPGQTSLQAPSITIRAGSGIALGDAILGGGTLLLGTTAGGVTQTSGGSITVNALQTDQIGIRGDVSLIGRGNAIDSVSGITAALGGGTGGNTVIVNSTDLTLTGAYNSNRLLFDVSKPGGSLALGAGVTQATLSVASGGSIGLVADRLAVAPASTINAPSGTVEIAPFSAIPVDFAAAGQALTIDPASVLPAIRTDTLRIGAYTDLAAGAATLTRSATTVSIDAPVDLRPGPSTTIATTLDLHALGDITEAPGGSLTNIGTLTGQAGVAPSAALPNGMLGSADLAGATPITNRIATLGPFLTTGSLVLSDGMSLTVTGPVTTGAISATNPSAAGRMFGAAINVPGNTLTLSGRLTAGLAAAGAPPGTTVSGGDIGLAAGTILIPGAVVAASGTGGGGTLTTVAGFVITETGSIVADVLTGSSGNGAGAEDDGSAHFAGNNRIATLGGFATNASLAGSAGDFVLIDASDLVVAGAVSANGGSATIAAHAGANALGVATPGDLHIDAPVTADRTVSLIADASIAVNAAVWANAGDATLVAGLDIANSGAISAARDASLTAGRDIATAGTVGAGGHAALTAGGGIAQTAGLITAAGADSPGAPSVALLARSGSIVQSPGAVIVATDTGSPAVTVALGAADGIGFGGTIVAGGIGYPTAPTGTVTLSALNGDVTETVPGAAAPSGLVAAGLLTVVASDNVLLNTASAPGNAIVRLGASRASSGNFLLVDAATGGGALTLQGEVAAGGTLSLVSASSITQAPGTTIRAALLTGSAAGDARLTGTPAGNQVPRLGSFTSGGVLALNDGVDLTVAGPLTAPTLAIDTGAHAVTLADRTVITTGGTPRPFVVPPFPSGTSSPPAGGAFFTTSSGFTQQGSVTVAGLGGGPSVFRVNAGGAANIRFDPLAGLRGADTWLILDIGTGNATGQINVRNLDVIRFGLLGSADLTGTVTGIAGPAAAGVSGIQPSPNPNFRLNTCMIHSVSCFLLAGEGVPTASPLNDINIDTLSNPNADDDLLLPIVSDQDY